MNKPPPSIHTSQSPGKYTTTSANAYKSVEFTGRTEPKSYQIRKRNVRKHNFNFGNETHTDYNSAMKHDYVYEAPEANITSKEIKEKLNRPTVVSERPGCYISTNFQEFKGKGSGNGYVKVKKQERLNFEMQNEAQTMVSMNQIAFAVKSPEIATLSPEKLADLKSSHFNLGTGPGKYTISSAQPYHQGYLEGHNKHSLSPKALRFGEEGSDFNTNYSMNFTRPKSQSNNSKIQQKKSMNTSNVILGDEPSAFVPQNYSTYQKMPASPTKLPPDVSKNRRAHHFELGQDGKSYKTIAQNYETHKIEGAFDIKETSFKMKQSNWNFGNYPSQQVSNSRKEYEWRGGGKHVSRSNKEIRESHFNVGTDRDSNWQSNYKSNYHWIQPVPDTNYKYSTMN